MTRRSIAVIPARAGSKRVPAKNLRPVCGQPLITWSIRAAVAAGSIDETIVSTDDPAAAALARGCGVRVYDRPADLAGDHASSLAVLRQVCEQYGWESGALPEFVVLLQPTSPFREKDLIDTAMARLRGDARATSLQTVFPVRHFTGRLVDGYWQGDYPETTRSQDLPTLYVPSGTLYIYRYDETIARGDAWGARVLPLIQDRSTVVNIDEEADFVRCEDVARLHRDRYAHLLE